MRLDHLLSKEEEVGESVVCGLVMRVSLMKKKRRYNLKKISGGDAHRVHTRSHPEHDG